MIKAAAAAAVRFECCFAQMAADDCMQFSSAKIERICASTVTAPPPTIEDRCFSEPMTDFEPTTTEEIATILNGSTRSGAVLAGQTRQWSIGSCHCQLVQCIVPAVASAAQQQAGYCPSTAEVADSGPE
jgi:hypothetical protein